MPSEHSSRSVQCNFLVNILDVFLLVWDFDGHFADVGLVHSCCVRVRAEFPLLGGAAAGWEGASATRAAGAVAVRRVAVAVGGKWVDFSVSVEDDGRRSGGEVIAVLNPVGGSVGLDWYFDGIELGVIHNSRHESPLLISSRNFDCFGIEALLGVGAHHISGTASPDRPAAVAAL